MTTNELSGLIGKTGYLTHRAAPGFTLRWIGGRSWPQCGAYRSLRFRVEIVDAVEQYGTVRVQVRPRDGDGLVWVDLESVTLAGFALGVRP